MKPLILIILDGFGLGGDRWNAIKAANTPNLNKIFGNNPISKLSASGLDVGLPEGQMGNSEVGHANIGAGRIVYQELTRISKSIENKTFFENIEIKNGMEYVKTHDSTLHLLGLLSDGGVHSHTSHLYALIQLAKNYGINDVYIHAWLDGRDSPPSSGINYLEECENKLKEIGIGKIATVCGRFYSMDRDNRWERISKAYDAISNAKGNEFDNILNLIRDSYDSGVTDEFVVPSVYKRYNGINSNDVVICFNFRPDRVREITKCFTDKNFDEIRLNKVYPKKYICFTRYDPNMPDLDIAFKPQTLNNTLGKYLSSKGLKQLRIAETEKYAHVTFFFNGGIETPFPGEDRILVLSPKISTYDLKPQMSAYEVTDKVISSVRNGIYDIIILNYANCDMVGHTGMFDATVKAVETVDKCIGKLKNELDRAGYTVIITADHGNAEKMLSDTGIPFTSHTNNLVPFCVVNYDCIIKQTGKLADISPTILDIMGIPKPSEMSGESLLIH